jgi:hypothetical protein
MIATAETAQRAWYLHQSNSVSDDVLSIAGNGVQRIAYLDATNGVVYKVPIRLSEGANKLEFESAQALSEYLGSNPKVRVPETQLFVLDNGVEILAMEYIENDCADYSGVARDILGDDRRLVDAFMGDFHDGNYRVRNNQIYLIDLGLCNINKDGEFGEFYRMIPGGVEVAMFVYYDWRIPGKRWADVLESPATAC